MQKITDLLNKKVNIEIFDTLPSTNSYLSELAKNGLKENTAVIAKEQTAGRGRQGRSFFSPQGGLYLSALFFPQKLKAEDGWMITTSAAVSVCRAIEKVCGKTAEIKWVNDIFSGGKKVSGILCETAYAEHIPYAVIGVGVNIFRGEPFPDDIKDTAGALFSSPQGEEIYNLLAAEIISSIYSNEFLKTFDEYKRRQFLTGKKVTILSGNDTFAASVTGLDDRCRLEVTDENGKTLLLSSGEVRVKV